MAAERISLDEPPRALAIVLVALVRADHDDGADVVAGAAHGLEHVDGAEHVDLVGHRRVAQRAPDHRLGCQVQHDLGPGLEHRLAHGVRVTHVDGPLTHVGGEAGQLVERGLRWRAG